MTTYSNKRKSRPKMFWFLLVYMGFETEITATSIKEAIEKAQNAVWTLTEGIEVDNIEITNLLTGKKVKK